MVRVIIHKNIIEIQFFSKSIGIIPLKTYAITIRAITIAEPLRKKINKENKKDINTTKRL